ncbi:MAG: succinate dehydrogenase cytochrome b subunit [Muribaculaceae bacterium]|nr:succinate dehydrogenase cytochrome b subunit [Muribaculaceae bacterium]
MWLTSSSIGRKVIMAVTGAALILFLTFHVLMNSVAILWPAAYNSVCAFLGANWYALIACAGLAVLFIAHILYAFVLTMQNRKARGNDSYAVTATPKSVEWSSKNMLVLGIVVVAFLAVHFIQFWYKMQFQEIIGNHYYETAEGILVPATAGSAFLHIAFESIWTPVVYIIGFAALWLHMNHGFWSMFQSAGWNNTIWLPRLKKIACGWTSVVVGLFVIQAVWFTYEAKTGSYLNDPKLNEQITNIYIEHLQKEGQEIQKIKDPVQREAAIAKLQVEERKVLRSIKAIAPVKFAEMGIPEEYLQEPVVEEAPAAPVAPEQPDTTVVNQEPANN